MANTISISATHFPQLRLNTSDTAYLSPPLLSFPLPQGCLHIVFHRIVCFFFAFDDSLLLLLLFDLLSGIFVLAFTAIGVHVDKGLVVSYLRKIVYEDV